jgi:hypothetical protein
MPMPNRIPDQETHMGEALRLAQEARLTPQEAATQPTGLIAPLHLGDTGIVPERYVIHYSFVQCKNCGSATRESEFYALTYLRSRMDGKRVRHLTKCASPEFNLPVDKILTGCSKIPYCQECSSIDLSHLPPPPKDANVTVHTLADPTLKGQKPKTATTKPTTPPKKASIDDLI